MNIDRRKFQEKMKAVSGSQVMRTLDACVIKQTSCTSCIYDKTEQCSRCSVTYANQYKPVVDEKEGLFVGAPIMISAAGLVGVERADSDGKTMTTYKSHTRLGDRHEWRLPSIAEAPRNTWLAPWAKPPEQLFEHKVLLRLLNSSVLTGSEYFNSKHRWVDVASVMLEEDFEYS